MLISKFIDRYALYDLHKKKSKISHYLTPQDITQETIDRETFYKSNPVNVTIDLSSTEKDYKIGSFAFNSSLPSGITNNDMVKGDVFLNEDEENKPNIIFVHGWRMESFDRIKKIFHDRIMNEFGWNMYYFPLPFHFQRQPEDSLYSGELMISANINRTVDSTRQGIVDLRTLINWLKINKKGPIYLVGVSLGGWITNLAATLEEEIDGIVSIFYANKLSHSIWNTIPGKFIKKDLEQNGVTYEDLERYWDILDPSQAKPKVNKNNILLISGRFDQYIDLNDANHLWEAWGKPPRHIYNCGHAGIVLQRTKIATDTLSFIHERVKR
ncbi:alpha/beta hydrolase [Robertmurraya korlensis]|uniref:alpha/beta hydrolase n=1 Tax=Robertmurraya korlensis TaxID=519977 RepID=UPI00203EAA73|nr:alpha/beta hydrolase family protein [Robertmurraya korlensis]MCM3603137.1 alpha/beta hydrolase [Robertmurraya korlensis]